MIEFDFKKLIVWQKSMALAELILEICESVKGHYRLVEQLESCSASVPQNITEGKGRHSIKEYIHFLYISRGSLYECITLLNLFQRKGIISAERLNHIENQAGEILKMLNALISSQRTKLQDL